ncbi:MAG: NINE protein [Lachnospiraceae bacterium]|nr:NINE protein [Lachnospiraceae bacterium]
MYCKNCGSSMNDNAKFCPKCGTPVTPEGSAGTTFSDYGNATAAQPAPEIEVSEKSWLAALLLEIFLGGLGIHRFYVGKIGTGILWLLTAGIVGIGWIVDLVMIATGKFKDKQGRYLKSDSWKRANETMDQIHRTSSADELIKLKQLLDEGVITQEQFEKKRDEYLNQC